MNQKQLDVLVFYLWLACTSLLVGLALAAAGVGAPAPLPRKETPESRPAWLCVPHHLVWSGVRYRVEFSPDGTFRCATDDGENYYQWRGRWEYRDSVLVYREWSASRFGVDASPSLTITFDLSADGWRGRCGCAMRAEVRKPDF